MVIFTVPKDELLAGRGTPLGSTERLWKEDLDALELPADSASVRGVGIDTCTKPACADT